MATYQSGLQQDFWSKYYQRRAQKGSGLSASEMAALYEPMGAYEYQKSLAAEERARQQANLDRQYDLQKKRDEDAAAAAKVSGVTSMVGTGANIYLAKKLLDIYSGKKLAPVPPMAPSVTPAVAPELAPGAVAPGAANVGAAAPVIAGEGAQAGLASAYASAPEMAAGTGMGEGLAATYGAEEVAAATPGVVSSVAPYALPAAGAAALLAGGKYVSDQLHWENTLGKTGERIVSTALAPIIAPTMFVAKGAEKLWDKVSDVADTVICTELARQGLVSGRLRKIGMIFGARAGFDVYKGYRILAEPVVGRMRRSKRYTRFVAFFAIPTMHEMAHLLECTDKGNLLGKAVLAIGIPMCRRAYRKSCDVLNVAEVA